MQIAHLRHDAPVLSQPGSGRRIATLRARTPWLHAPTAAWLERVTPDGRWGRVRVPWRSGAVHGWIALRHARVRSTNLRVEVSRSRHTLEVWRGAHLVSRMRAGVGATASPTPTGRFVVSERVRTRTAAERARYGAFAFGLSGLQPHPPAGWHGPAQLAIHGTGDPSSIGRAVSAGCVRIARAGLDRLAPLLAIGTPVIIRD
jgi:lipoprotein-anchoring transpeptidase ErfK/SrfK